MSTTMPLRERKRRRTYLDLARAALYLFKKNGYEQTTVEQITERAEYSMSTFFRYFGSKEDVAFFTVQHLFPEFGTEIAALPAGKSPWQHITEQLVAVCRRLSEFAPDLGEDPIALWLREPALDRRFRELSMAWERQIAVAYAQHKGLDPDTSLESQIVARSVISAAHAGFHLHVKTGADLGDMVQQAMDLLGEGLAD